MRNDIKFILLDVSAFVSHAHIHANPIVLEKKI